MTEPTADLAALARIAKRHKKREFYRGEQTPNHSNHRTGAVAICAACHQPWPCDASLLAASRPAVGEEGLRKALVSDEYTRGWNEAMEHAARIADSLAASAALATADKPEDSDA